METPFPFVFCFFIAVCNLPFSVSYLALAARSHSNFQETRVFPSFQNPPKNAKIDSQAKKSSDFQRHRA